MKKPRQIGRWLCCSLLAVAISGLAFYFCSANPVLGRWTLVGSKAPNPSSYTFYRTRRFESLWFCENGVQLRFIGSYKLLPGERVELRFTNVNES